jgi:hypothetical protein
MTQPPANPSNPPPAPAIIVPPPLLPPRIVRRPCISYKAFTLPANGLITHNVSGNFFLCKSCAADFWMQIDGGEMFLMTAGLSFDLASLGLEEFHKFTFINKTGVDNAIAYYASNVPMGTVIGQGGNVLLEG